jgi:outer membrane protein TolC
MKRALFVLSLLRGIAWGETLTLDLATVEQNTLRHSPSLRATQEIYSASAFSAAAQSAQLSPTLGIEGYYRHQSEVPSFRASPASPLVELGDNENYSVGPAINWLLWDSGAIRRSVAALNQQSLARTQDIRATENQLILNARLHFFQIQGMAEGLRLFADALRLALAQENDVRIRYQAGSASRQELLQAETEVLARRREFRKAQTSLAGTIRDLLTLMGTGDDVDLSHPLPENVNNQRPAGIPLPSLVLAIPAPSLVRPRLEGLIDRPFDDTRPEILSLAFQAQAARDSAQAVKAGHGPSLQVSAKTSLDYPNGPLHEQINQNAIGAMARWSLFEGGRIKKETREQEALARSAEERRRQTEEDLRRDWQRAREHLIGFKEEEAIAAQSIERHEKLAKLVYESYLAGQNPFLEVQAANLGLLNAHVQSVTIEVNILSQLARIASLTTEGTP